MQERAIARHYGVTQQALSHAARRLDLPGVYRRWTADEIDFLRRCAARGVTWDEIGSHLNRSGRAVGGKASALGIKSTLPFSYGHAASLAKARAARRSQSTAAP